jgi:hypothetical protein
VYEAAPLCAALAWALARTGRTIEIAHSLDDARAALAHRPEILLIETRLFGAGGGELVATARTAGAAACVVLCDRAGSDETTVATAATAVAAVFPILCVTHVPDPASELAAEALAITVSKLAAGEVFGLEQHVRATVHAEALVPGADRRPAIARLWDHITTAGLGARLRFLATQATDELLSNALLRAPPPAAATAASAAAAAPLVRLRYAADDCCLAIEVRDAYGTLAWPTFVRCVSTRSPALLGPRSGRRGAGMGLALTAGYATHLLCNLAPGRLTELIALFDLRAAPRPTAPGTSSFQTFVAPLPMESVP